MPFHTQKIDSLRGAGFLLFIAVLVFPFPGTGQAASVKESVRQGSRLYRQGQFADSLKMFQDALKTEPESDIVNFNTGTALYKEKQYGDAVGHFQKAILSDDASLREGAHYNLGNSLYKFGIAQEKTDISAAITALQESLKHLAGALALDKKDQDAQYNYDFVNKELERLRKEQQKQQQQSQENPNGQKSQEQQQPHADAQQTDQQENSHQPQSDISRAQEQKDEELTKSEAQRLLQNYQQTEEPQGLLHVFQEKHETGAVIKDW